MIIRQIVAEIRRQLNGKYPDTEIDSFVRILFKQYLNITAVEIHLSQENELSPEVERQILTAVSELAKFRPIQYITGKTEFYGLQFELTPDVLIPRPETEELVDWIIQNLEIGNRKSEIDIIDIGVGSGCIAVALKANLPNAEVWAIDVSEPALSVARRNAAKNNVKINFIQHDILKDDLTCFGHNSLDLIVSNPPYITPSEKSEMQPNVLEYEPHCALFAPEDDPLIFFKRITIFGVKSLKKNGRIFFEINETYHAEVADILKQHGFSDISLRKDINGKWRMISARK